MPQAPARSGAVREWVGAMAGVVALVVVLVAVVAMLEPLRAGPPAAAIPSGVPVQTITPEPVGARPEIVMIGDDLLVSPPEGGLPGSQVFRDQEVVAATALGERGEYTAIGMVGSDDLVCLTLARADGARGQCVSYAVFEAEGVAIDMGSWSVRWWADHVEWTSV